MKTIALIKTALHLLLVGSLCGQSLTIPPRLKDALAGKQFADSICQLSREEREKAIYDEVIKGNIPEFIRRLVPINDSAVINGKPYKITYFVAPDYLSIGTDEDYFLMPMSAPLAQKIADALGCSLPTKKIVDRIYSSAKLKLPPQPISPSAAMVTIPVFVQHNDSVLSIRKKVVEQYPLQTLSAGAKKDIIISNLISRNLKTNVPRPVVIYGWHRFNGLPIQPVYNGHEESYADYSHGVRLVKDSVIVNGAGMPMKEILMDSSLSVLLSDEGVILQPYYGVSNQKQILKVDAREK